MNIASFLEQIAQLHSDRPALSIGERRWCSYGELGTRVACVAGALQGAMKMTRGDRVAMVMDNSPEYVELKLAAWHAGLCIVPINAKLHPREIAYILSNCGARLCFVDDGHADAVRPLVAEVETLDQIVQTGSRDYEIMVSQDPCAIADCAENEPAWIFYTSGTTGNPKGATLSHRNLWAMSWRYFADIDALDHRDSYIHAAPISHGSGLYGLPHLMRASNIIIPESRGFDVAEMFGLMDRYSNLTFFAAPTMVTRMTAQAEITPPRVEALKTIYYGGAPMYLQDMKRALDAFGPCFHQIFGQGESPMTGIGLSKAQHAETNHPRFEARLASTGVARIGVEVRIVDGDDKDVAVGEPGEVLFRSDVVMLGYWNNPEATAETLRGGWLHTGDIGVFDEDGFVTLKDRSKDMIISGGTNIYPREIEEILLSDSRLDEVSVVGRPHADWGEEVVAFVVAKENMSVTPEELDALCLANIARFKRPKEYFFLRSLPKSNYGKILKRQLRQSLADAGTPQG
jgi:acyl-CoA synthetase (AMP-forming)/AMP-acid ligase II